MAHKAFEVIGEKIIVYRDNLGIEGIFQTNQFSIKQKCACCGETIEVIPGRTLDFVSPLYTQSPFIERLAMGKIPRERINPRNPILHFWSGIDLSKLEYAGKNYEKHIFKGELHAPGVYFNDGNFEVFNKYVEPLRKAGFEIYAVGVG